MHAPAEPQRPYYGWAIVATLAFTETISWGILYYALTVFIAPMEAELGWTRAQLSGGLSLALLVMGVMAYPVGVWVDRHGGRLLMTLGSLLASLLVLAWSQVRDLNSFYAVWFGIGVCGAAVLYEPAFTVVTAWFSRQRGRALAIITFAGGLASTIFLPLADALLRAFGWRQAVLLLGLLLAITTILPHALVLRRRPQDVGLHPDGAAESALSQGHSARLGEVIRQRPFWLLILAFACSYLAATAARVHFIPFLIEGGVDGSLAALAGGSIGIMQVLGRVVFAPLAAGRSGQRLVLSVFIVQGLAMLALFGSPAPWAVLLFVVLYGTSHGASVLARANIVAEQYGVAHYGRISSVMALFLTFASTIAPVGAGLVHDHFGNYSGLLLLLCLFSVGAVLVISRLPSTS